MSSASPQRILLTTDFWDDSAIPYAVALASYHGARLDLIHVAYSYDDVTLAHDDATTLASHDELMKRRAHQLLDAIAFPETLDVQRHVVRGDSAAAGIVEAAKNLESELIVIASRGRRVLAQIVLGSVARNVIAAASCPVLCVKSAEHGMLGKEGDSLRIRRVLVPTDLSERSAAVLPMVGEMAVQHGSTVDLLHSVQLEIPPMYFGGGVQSIFELDPDLRERVASKLERMSEPLRLLHVPVELSVVDGPPSKAIAGHAEETDADVIVMARRGLGDTPHLLGGVPERLLHDAHTPILIT